MVQKIKRLFAALAIASLTTVPVFAVAPVAFAQVNQTQLNQQLCCGTNFDINCTTGGTCSAGAGTSNFESLLTNIINIFSIIVGVIAVVMIIVGGLRYITSGGDTGKVGAAKTTIIYALIGLVIVALAQLIVHFVLNQANNVAAGA